MQCPVCSKEVEPQSAFCKHCGASIAGAPAAASGYSTVPGSGASAYSAPAAGAGYTHIPGSAGQGYTAVPPQPGNMPPTAVNPGLSENAAAAIAYITIVPAIVFLVLEPYNRMPLVRFHSWQSIGLFLAAVVLHFAATFFGIMLHFIPFVHLLFLLVQFVISVLLFVFWLIALLKASRGEWYKLPIIGDFAEKQARA